MQGFILEQVKMQKKANLYQHFFPFSAMFSIAKIDENSVKLQIFNAEKFYSKNNLQKKKKPTNLSSQSYTINYKGTYFLLKYKKKKTHRLWLIILKNIKNAFGKSACL